VLAKICGGHKIHKNPADERLAFTPEDLCIFAQYVLANGNDLVAAARRDCKKETTYG
jgi:hypothetical protein